MYVHGCEYFLLTFNRVAQFVTYKRTDKVANVNRYFVCIYLCSKYVILLSLTMCDFAILTIINFY